MKKEFLGQLMSAFDKQIDMRIVFTVSTVNEEAGEFTVKGLQFGDETDKVITTESDAQSVSSLDDLRLANEEERDSYEAATQMTIEQYHQKAISAAFGIDFGLE